LTPEALTYLLFGWVPVTGNSATTPPACSGETVAQQTRAVKWIAHFNIGRPNSVARPLGGMKRFLKHRLESHFRHATLVALAMGAAEVVAAGRNRAVLDALAELPRVRTVAMTGDPDIDAAAVGVVDLGLGLVGQASSASGTLAVLKALRRGGRLVLMGSMTVPLPVD